MDDQPHSQWRFKDGDLIGPFYRPEDVEIGKQLIQSGYKLPENEAKLFVHNPGLAALQDAFNQGVASGQQADWQPIATAPKDGTRILVFVPEGSPDESGVHLIEWYWETWAITTDECDWRSVSQPTHWMPLPEPPKCQS